MRDRRRGFSTTTRHAQYLIRKQIGQSACRQLRHHPLSQSAQVLHKGDAQRDRQRPQFPNGQWLHPLISLDEARQFLNVEGAVSVGNERPGDAEDARMAVQWPVRQFWQTAVEAGWKVTLDLANLFLNDVKIIKQLFRSRRDWLALRNRLNNSAMAFGKYSGVVIEPFDNRKVSLQVGCNMLCGGQALRMLFKTFYAENFSPNRWLWRLPYRLPGRVKGHEAKASVTAHYARTLNRLLGDGRRTLTG